MKTKIKEFLVTIKGMSTLDLTNILGIIGISPLILLFGLVSLLKIQIPFAATGITVGFIGILFISAFLIMVIRKEIPVYPPFRPIKGNWAVIVAGIPVVLLIIYLVILIKSLFVTNQ